MDVVVVMVGQPIDHFPLGRHATKHEEHAAQPRIGLVRRMRALTVKPERNPEQPRLRSDEQKQKRRRGKLQSGGPPVRRVRHDVRNGRKDRDNRSENDDVGDELVMERLLPLRGTRKYFGQE
jgi:hypothetical protein